MNISCSYQLKILGQLVPHVIMTMIYQKRRYHLKSEMIKIWINTLTFQHVTPEEQDFCYFTSKKLKPLSTWKEWKDVEIKQLDQFHIQKMIGELIYSNGLPNSAVILQQFW